MELKKSSTQVPTMQPNMSGPFDIEAKDIKKKLIMT